MRERLFLHLDDETVLGPPPGGPDAAVRAFAASPALRGQVSNILLYREHFGAGEEVLERVLPDGAARLVFNLGDAPSANGIEGLPVEAIGASTEAVMVRLRRRMAGLSITLRPGAAALLLGLPAGELAGRALHLDELWGGEGTLLLERMALARDDAARVALLDAALCRRLAAADGRAWARFGPHPGALHAARLIAASAGRRPLREVAEAVGLGERRLQQLFHAQVGLSPRAWRRLARMHGCLRALRGQPAPAWAELAAEHGFYDQSHLVNEFRALCGVTPTEFLDRAIAGSSKTPV